MNDSAWNEVVAQLTDDDADVDTWVAAATRIHRESELRDIPRLVELLKHDSFFVREAAAWPLAELAGPSVLPDLLATYQRGFDDGHDNDGFAAALLEIPVLHPSTTKVALVSIARASQSKIKGHAEWLLGFCE